MLVRCIDAVVPPGWKGDLDESVHPKVHGCKSLGEAIDRVCPRRELLHWAPTEWDRPEYEALGAALEEFTTIVRRALER